LNYKKVLIVCVVHCPMPIKRGKREEKKMMNKTLKLMNEEEGAE